MTNFPVELFKDIETPFYYYDSALLKRTLETVKKSAETAGPLRLPYPLCH